MDNRTIVKMNLEMLDNCQVIFASEGRTGIKIAERINPDIILLDLILPGMDGFEILRTLKKNKETTDIPVIMLTVKGDEASKLRALKLYSDDYISKPVGADKLRARIKKILSKKEKDSMSRAKNNSLAKT